jgi:hypothetical protein
LTVSNVWIEKAGPLSRGFPEETRGAMVNRHPRIKDIISGIILLAARGEESMPLKKVHSIIHAMKSHESILSGLRFSLTGAVCYSRDIDHAINYLSDGGFLDIVDGSAFVGESAPEFGNYLSGFLTNSQIQAVHSASLRFHERVRRDVKDPRDRP